MSASTQWLHVPSGRIAAPGGGSQQPQPAASSRGSSKDPRCRANTSQSFSSVALFEWAVSPPNLTSGAYGSSQAAPQAAVSSKLQL